LADTDVNELAVNPFAVPSAARVVTITTPLG